MSSSNSVTVQILDKEYSIICPPEERSSLVSAARYLDGKMREIRSSGKVIGADRIAVMAACLATRNSRLSFLRSGGPTMRVSSLSDHIHRTGISVSATIPVSTPPWLCIMTRAWPLSRQSPSRMVSTSRPAFL